ncbi:MAG: rod shape-determining protein MreD [Carboxydocellales bacterium]
MLVRWAVLALLLVISLVLETTLFHWLSVWGVQPDLVLVLVVFFALFSGSSGGAFFGFLGGLAQDALSGQYLGLNAFSKMITGYIVAQLERKIYKDYPLIPVLVVFVVSLASHTLIFLLLLPITTQPTFTELYIREILPAAAYNCLIAGLTYSKFRQSITRGWLKLSEY